MKKQSIFKQWWMWTFSIPLIIAILSITLYFVIPHNDTSKWILSVFLISLFLMFLSGISLLISNIINTVINKKTNFLLTRWILASTQVLLIGLVLLGLLFIGANFLGGV